MAETNITPALDGSNRLMMILGLVILISVFSYFAFSALNSWNLHKKQGTATVTDKQFHEMQKIHVSQIINGKPVNVPQTRPAYHSLSLTINDTKAMAVIDASLYSQINVGDKVPVIYQEKRFTKGLEVLEVQMPR